MSDGLISILGLPRTRASRVSHSYCSCMIRHGAEDAPGVGDHAARSMG